MSKSYREKTRTLITERRDSHKARKQAEQRQERKMERQVGRQFRELLYTY